MLTNHPAGLDEEQLFLNKLYDLEVELGEAFSFFVYSKENFWRS